MVKANLHIVFMSSEHLQYKTNCQQTDEVRPPTLLTPTTWLRACITWQSELWPVSCTECACPCSHGQTHTQTRTDTRAQTPSRECGTGTEIGSQALTMEREDTRHIAQSAEGAGGYCLRISAEGHGAPPHCHSRCVRWRIAATPSADTDAHRSRHQQVHSAPVADRRVAPLL